ncbi:MAG: ROK family protein [Bacillota bacterium]|nr:ROK family protein [Bacillota bacterium]
MIDEFIVGIDVGGTKVMVGVARLCDNHRDYEEIQAVRFPTQADGGAERVLNRIISETRELLGQCGVKEDSQVKAVAVGIPSIVHPRNQSVKSATNIPGWEQVSVRSRLSEAVPAARVVLENDVNLAAIAELRRGAGRDFQSFLLVAVGTGIGCGVIIDGKLYKGIAGAAGEIGAMWVPGSYEPAMPFSQERKTYEDLASGAWLSKNLGGVGGIEQAFEEHLSQVEPGYGTVERWILTLEAGIFNAVTVLAPEAVILGGGVLTRNPWIGRRIADSLQRWAFAAPVVRFAELGEKAPLVGALQVALDLANERY